MNIKATQTNGKYSAKVSDGDRILFVTPDYYTEDMALTAAKCWNAFHGEKEVVDMVWVPVDRGQEVELPYDDAMRIALEYAVVLRLDRQKENEAKHRALRPLLRWVRETHGLTSRDMAQITNWWWTVEAKAAAERGRKAVEDAKRNG
jgi:hypothetical protein